MTLVPVILPSFMRWQSRTALIAVLAGLFLQVSTGCQHRDPQLKLRTAILEDDLGRARTLLRLGVEVNKVSILESPFALTCFSGSTTMCELMLNHGAELNVRQAYGGRYPIHMAALSGSIAKVRLLRERGADLHVRDGEGRTVMFSASGNGHAELVKMLANWGLDVNARDNEGNTPLLALVTDIQDFRQGIRDFNSTLADDSDRILNEKAEVERLLETVRALAQCGADMNAVNDQGECAIQLVDRGNEPELRRILIECGYEWPETEGSSGAEP